MRLSKQPAHCDDHKQYGQNAEEITQRCITTEAGRYRLPGCSKQRRDHVGKDGKPKAVVGGTDNMTYVLDLMYVERVVQKFYEGHQKKGSQRKTGYVDGNEAGGVRAGCGAEGTVAEDAKKEVRVEDRKSTRLNSS